MLTGKSSHYAHSGICRDGGQVERDGSVNETLICKVEVNSQSCNGFRTDTPRLIDQGNSVPHFLAEVVCQVNDTIFGGLECE